MDTELERFCSLKWLSENSILWKTNAYRLILYSNTDHFVFEVNTMVKALGLCCRVCGAKFTSRDDIEEDVYGTGFWCPECDGYTPYADSNRSSDIDLSVCLETRAVKGHESESRKPKSFSRIR